MKKFIKTISFCLLLSLAASNLFPAISSAAETTPEKPAYYYIRNNSSKTISLNAPLYSPFSATSKSRAASKTSYPDGACVFGRIGGETVYQNEPRTFGVYDTEERAFSLYSATDSKDYNQETVTFVSTDFSNSSSVKFNRTAKRFYKGEVCDVFFQNEATSTGDTFTDDEKKEFAEKVAKAFEETIRPYILNCVGSYMGNDSKENGSIIILLEDIKDGYKTSEDTYTAGYYSPYENIGLYNGTVEKNIKLVHLDLYPLAKQSAGYAAEEVFSTLAHEFTHLVEGECSKTSDEFSKTWFKEFFALSVEGTLYPEKNDLSRASSLTFDDCISKGSILNYETYNDNKNSISANYGLMYLFGKYINARTLGANGTSDILKQIIAAEKTTSNCEEALAKALSAKESTQKDFSQIAREFYMAMTLCEKTGIYSFKNDDLTGLFKLPLSFGGNITLKPGAAVVVPVFGKTFSSDISGLECFPFSPDKENLQTDFYFLQKKVYYPPLSYFSTPYLITGGKVAESYNDIRHLIISIDNNDCLTLELIPKAEMPAGYASPFIYMPTVSMEDMPETNEIICRSAADETLFDSQKFMFQDDNYITLGTRTAPTLTEKDGKISLENWETYIYRNDKETYNFNMRIAAYDDRGMFLGCITNGNFIGTGTCFIDLSGTPLNGVSPSYNGVYVFKMFILNSDNSNLTPITNVLEVTVKP